MQREVRRFPNLDELNCDAAAFIGQWARDCVARRGAFHLALSGGHSPRRLYRKLARAPFDVSVPWSQVRLYLGDERWVPAQHADSNYRMVFETLISQFAVPAHRVYRPPYDAPNPEQAAAQWERRLKESFPQEARRGELPCLDLVLLGVGSDGHTASLFPGDPALEERQRWVTAVTQPRGTPPVPRLTLTLPLINHARCALFIVSGAGKRDVVKAILEAPDPDALPYPAARVRPSEHLLWLLDGAYV